MTLFSICAWGTLLCLLIAIPAYAADVIRERTACRPAAADAACEKSDQ